MDLTSFASSTHSQNMKHVTFIRRILPAFVLVILSAITQAQTVNYKIVYDDPMPRAPFRVSADVLTTALIAGNAGMGIGLRAEYFYNDKFTFNLWHQQAYVDDLSTSGEYKDVAKRFAFSELGGQYHISKKTKTVPVNVITRSKKTEGNKKVYIESEMYNVNGTKGKYKTLQAGVMRYRAPDANDLTNRASMHYSNAVYVGLKSSSSINTWAESQYGIGGFRNYWGMYGDVILSINTRTEELVPAEKTIKYDNSSAVGFRFGVFFDGVSDHRAPNLGFLSTRLESGWYPGPLGGFYLNFGSGLSFDAGKHRK